MRRRDAGRSGDARTSAATRDGSAGWACSRSAAARHRGRCSTRRLLDSGRERGVTRVRLEVLEQNAPAIAIYRRLGFIDSGTSRSGGSRHATAGATRPPMPTSTRRSRTGGACRRTSRGNAIRRRSPTCARSDRTLTAVSAGAGRRRLRRNGRARLPLAARRVPPQEDAAALLLAPFARGASSVLWLNGPVDGVAADVAAPRGRDGARASARARARSPLGRLAARLTQRAAQSPRRRSRSHGAWYRRTACSVECPHRQSTTAPGREHELAPLGVDDRHRPGHLVGTVLADLDRRPRSCRRAYRRGQRCAPTIAVPCRFGSASSLRSPGRSHTTSTTTSPALPARCARAATTSPCWRRQDGPPTCWPAAGRCTAASGPT